MYLMRLVYRCQRGKASEVVECLKVLNQIYTQDGCKNGRISVDRTGPMDRAVFEFELEGVDAFFARLNQRYANLSPAGQQLVGRLNEFAVAGERELYEVVA